MSKRNTTRFIAQPRLSALMLATLVLTGCANITPQPLADKGGRSAIKVPENRRPDPSRPGNGRAWAFGPRS